MPFGAKADPTRGRIDEAPTVQAYLFFVGSKFAHPFASLVCAADFETAVRLFEMDLDPDVQFLPDGSVRLRVDAQEYRYGDWLDYVECCHRWAGEWMVARLPAPEGDGVWDLLVAEGAGDAAEYAGRCRKAAPGEWWRGKSYFIWWLRSGVIVTFYRRVDAWRIRVTERFLFDDRREPRLWYGTTRDVARRIEDEVEAGPFRPGMGRPAGDKGGAP
jgi:hypothetical protein